MKRNKTNTARSGTSPYRKYEKRPYQYVGEIRLANGDLKTKANDRLKNKYA